MGLKQYNIPENYWIFLNNAPIIKLDSTKYILTNLLRESKFYIIPSKYMGGITFSKNFILLHQDFEQFSEPHQLRLIAHEGFHVAQQKFWGWTSFMWKYCREWIKCGFSYNKMKNTGIEKAAYDYEKLFAQQFFGSKKTIV